MIMARNKQLKAKEPIRIRFKNLSGGNKSIYLDIYRSGVRRYEFLRMYLIPETDEFSRSRNAATIQAVNVIKARRIIELTNNEAGIKNDAGRSGMLLAEWMQLYKERQQKRGRKDIRQISYTITLLERYAGSKIMMREIDKEFCTGFINYLTNIYVTPKYGRHLRKVTAVNYCRCLNCALNYAVRSGVIAENPFRLIDASEKIKAPESPREYLTIDEVKTLIRTPCRKEEVKRAYLFSCYCGLRISDIEALRWSNIIWDGDQSHIEMVQQKTEAPLYLPLSRQALKWMPTRKEGKTTADRIFDLPSQAYGNLVLKAWASSAGITKKITYHTARHTFATMMLTLGADLYTTSKLLGHSEISTTQIYAKIVNKKKEEAVNLVNDIFDEPET